MPVIAKVVVEIGLDREFDYLVPPELEPLVTVGVRVRVPFGRTEQRGTVVGLADHSECATLKAIQEVVSRKPVIEPRILNLARWLAEYYGAPVEHAVRAVLPAAVRDHRARFKERLFVAPVRPLGDAPDAVLEGLRQRAPRQAAVWERLQRNGPEAVGALLKAVGTTMETLRALERRGLVRVGPQSVLRNPLGVYGAVVPTMPLALMPQQVEALEVVKRAITTLQPPVVLLHGVTGSGKTEIYLQAIAFAREQGRGAIVLVPEIALTPQTIERFRGRFGEGIAVLHSGLSAGERHDEWHRVHEGTARIVIGARSAVFAPVKDLGLIVVDEEHEHTYKQEESPRYHARDVAVMRGRLEHCAVVLGSATPSLESYHNARIGKYHRVVLPHRVDHRQMPVVRVVDMRYEIAAGGGRVPVFSRTLLEAVRARLERAEQTILFLNRRGYATSLLCPKCGHVATCDQCSVTLTYHRQSEELLCHICGNRRRVPAQCPGCQDPAFKYTGIGTQRVEATVAKLFPAARVARMDSDATTAKDAHRRILGEFRTGRVDILIGTQMIAKGLHFPNVTLIGVMYADLGLHIPDFRAGERTFQLLTQVAGRAGRGDVPGEVIVQTFTPFHPAIQAARRLDYEGFCDQELEFRRELGYPPFAHLVCVGFRGPVQAKVEFCASAFAEQLRSRLPAGTTLSGPAPAPLARAKGEYRYQLLLRHASSRKIVVPLKALLEEFRWPAGVKCSLDVDAVSLM